MSIRPALLEAAASLEASWVSAAPTVLTHRFSVRVIAARYGRQMTNKTKQHIAGERLEDLIAGMRQMPIVAIGGTQVGIRMDPDNGSMVAFSGAAERYAADLLVPGSDLSRQERFKHGAQRVADEITRAVRNHDH